MIRAGRYAYFKRCKDFKRRETYAESNVLETEVACLMHERLCAGGSVERNRRECGSCMWCKDVEGWLC